MRAFDQLRHRRLCGGAGAKPGPRPAQGCDLQLLRAARRICAGGFDNGLRNGLRLVCPCGLPIDGLSKRGRRRGGLSAGRGRRACAAGFNGARDAGLGRRGARRFLQHRFSHDARRPCPRRAGGAGRGAVRLRGADARGGRGPGGGRLLGRAFQKPAVRPDPRGHDRAKDPNAARL